MFSLVSSERAAATGGPNSTNNNNANPYSSGANNHDGNNGIKVKQWLCLMLTLLFVLGRSTNLSSQTPPSHVTRRQVNASDGTSNSATTAVHELQKEQKSATNDNTEESNDDDDEESYEDEDGDEEPDDEEDEEEGPHDDEAAADLWNAMTLAPTTAPSPLPIIPDELLPKLPESPAYNFKVPQNNNGCALNMTGEAQMTNYPRRHALNNLVQVLQAGEFRPNADTGMRKRAICKFRRIGNYMHFPHMMQAFTRCMSFFFTFPNHERYIIRRPHQRYRLPFNLGISEIFKYMFNGKVTGSAARLIDESSIVVRPFYDTGFEEGPYQGIAFQQVSHAELLRRRVSNFYNISQEGCQPGKDYPVIGILNRNESRTLLNAEMLQKYLTKMTDKPVEITYFEGTSFLEQISFMMHTDILVSPHGAQLTSINFMSSCGGVFEAFPPGYWFPHFFGPLAATSGLNHGYVYTGFDWVEEWKKKGRKNKKERNFARVRDVCVPLNTSLTVIGQMVDNWKTCCHYKLKAQGRDSEEDDFSVEVDSTE